ncbi:MAG: T9SS type A sorting domain-containing protein [Bacteroidota bacterium]
MTIRNLLLLALLLGFYFGFGQFGEEQILTKCKVCLPIQMVSADLDNDGDFDIIAGEDGGEERIVWFRSDGTGNFGEPITILKNLKSLWDIKVADVNGDGHLDIFFSYRPTYWSTFKLLLNDGNANFTESVIDLGEIFSTKYLDFHDLDNDNDLDILVSSSLHGSFDDELVWYENIENLYFSNKIPMDTLENRFGAIETNDINSDGIIDVLVGSRFGGEIKRYSYQEGKIRQYDFLSVYRNSIKSIVADDIDNDSIIDLIVSHTFDNNAKVSWYKGLGNLEYSNPVEILNTRDGIFLVSGEDVDKDNYSDLVVRYSEEGTLFWLKNNGNGTFTRQETISRTEDGGNIFIVDIDKDSKLDFLSHTWMDDKISWYSREDNEEISEHIVTISETDGVAAIYGIDIDADDDLDILTVSSNDNDLPSLTYNKISWFPNNGDGTFNERIQISSENKGFTRIYPVDFDSDNDIDILSSTMRRVGISWVANNGVGVFSDHISVSEQAEAWAVSDIDQDGDQDILTFLHWTNNFGYLVNDGFGSFNERKDIQIAENVFPMQLVDINSDGADDFLMYRRTYVNTEAQFEYGWLENNGFGRFSNFKSLDFKGRLVLHPDDLDKDGDVDLVFLSRNNGDFGWYENKGNEVFNQRVIAPNGDRNRHLIHTVDIDNDNDIDILVEENQYPRTKISLYRNDRNGNFASPKMIVDSVSGLSHINTADLDKDGDQDILFTSIWEDKIAWIENLINAPSNKVMGNVFWDKNENGLFDDTDVILNHFPLDVVPEGLSAYTNLQGAYSFAVHDGDYTITAKPDSCWQLVTDSLSYFFNIKNNSTFTFNFGFQSASNFKHTQTRVNSGPTRCGFEVPFWMSIENDGCQVVKGELALVLEEKVEFISAEIIPNRIVGDTLYWKYEELIGTEVKNINLTLQIAGTEFLGDFIHLTGLSYIENEAGELELSSTYDYISEIRCAYDPNDKLVYPNRLGDYDKNYTLFEEELEYTVRFQNTGTDTAFTVVIKDYLDPNLNWKTFKPIIASHPHETLLHPDGLVEFTFKNILLPDSTTNEPLSHGFVTYKIRPNADLEENTNVENTANIFFDFNPPIQTNTTSNVLVEELPKKSGVKNESDLNFPIKVYPNPFEEVLTFELEQFQPSTLELFDARGQLIRTASIQNRVHQETMMNLPNGLYFYRLLSQEEQKLLVSGRVVKQ